MVLQLEMAKAMFGALKGEHLVNRGSIHIRIENKKI
jgi:hypothetical protein